jgi:hypothetical protein
LLGLGDSRGFFATRFRADAAPKSPLQLSAHEKYLECFTIVLSPSKYVDSSEPTTDHVCVVEAVMLDSVRTKPDKGASH